MPRSTVPQRGDIVWFNFSPQAGHEQAGHRPALILTKQPFQRATGFALVCPITSTIRGNSFEVALPKNTETQGVVLCHHVKTLDLSERLGGYIEKAPENVTTRVLEIVRILVS